MKLYKLLLLLLMVLLSPNLFGDNRSNQMNPNNSAYSSSRGTSPPSSSSHSNYDNNNRSNQMNPNNSAYWSSRGTSAPSRSSNTNYNNNRSNQMNPNNSAYWSSRGISAPSNYSNANYNNNRSNQMNPNNKIYWSPRGIKIKDGLTIKYLSGRVMIKTKNSMDTLFLDNVEISIKERFISAQKLTGFDDLYLLELNPGGSGTNLYYQLLIKNKKNAFDVTKAFGEEGDLKHIITSHERGTVVLQFSKHYFKYDKIPTKKEERDKITKSVLYKNGQLYIKDGDLFNDILKSKE